MTAHPDDESGAMGGTLAHYSRQGVDCRLICLTAGGAARNRGAATDTDDLKRLRRGELAAACKLLGIAGHEVWDLPDGGLPRVDFYDAARRLALAIRTQKPDLVLTLGPEGSVTGHPDHGMAGLLATAAYHWAGQAKYFPEEGALHQARRLFYVTVPVQPPMFPPVMLPPPDVSMLVKEFIDTKVAAFRAHTTQAPLADRVEMFMRMSGDHERYHLAAGDRNLTRDPERDGDLFEGLG